VPVAVALACPTGRGPAPLGTDDSIGISRQQRVDDRLQQRAHQIVAGLGERFAKQDGRVDSVWSGHRDGPRGFCGRLTRRITRWPRPRPSPGMPAGTGFHSLRDYFASLLIRHGESVKTVPARLGHASATETLDTYSHLWPDCDDRTREAIDSVLRAPADTLRTGEGAVSAPSQVRGHVGDEPACRPGSVPVHLTMHDRRPSI
jgi:hypothetical protein